MSRLESGHLGLEPATGEPQISDQIKKLMPSALVREMELEVVEVTVVVYGKLRHIEKRGEPLELLRLDRMFNYHDGVIDIPTLDQIVLEQVLYLVEEHESTARALA